MHRVFETIVKPLFNIEINYIEARRIGTKTLLARVYRLIGTAPFPGVLEVHDGAWISNNLTMATHTQKLSRSGKDKITKIKLKEKI